MLQRRTRTGSVDDRARTSVDGDAGMGPGSALDPRFRSQAEHRLGVGLGGVSIHTGPNAHHLAAALGARAVTVGDRIALGRGEYGPGTPSGDRLLAHEIAHVVQQRGPRTAGDGSVSGSVERDAEQAATELLDPHPGRDAPGRGGPQLRTGPAVHLCPTGSAGCAETSTSNISEPLASLPPESTPASASATSTESLVCEPEAAGICAGPPPSFDPDLVDVAGMRNDTLNVESLHADGWWNEHAFVSPPHPERDNYERYRRRLRDERSERVSHGHLWMTTANSQPPAQLYMLITEAGLTHVVTADLDTMLGVPQESYPGPVLTPVQFEDHVSSLGVPILTPEEYGERLRDAAAEVAPHLLVDPTTAFSAVHLADMGQAADPFGLQGGLGDDRFRGYVGGIPLIDTRASMLSHTMPYNNAKVRGGGIGEAFALSQSGFRGSDYNNAGWTWSGDPLRPVRPTRGNVPVADVRVLSGLPFQDLSVKVTLPDTAAAASPSSRTRFATYLKGQVDMLDTRANKFQDFASTYRPGSPLADVSSGMALAIPSEHVADYQALLRDATGFDRTDTGGQATKPNYRMATVEAVYRLTTLPQPIVLSDGTTARTGADLYAARFPESGNPRIPQAEFDTTIRRVGAQAASRVVGIQGVDPGVIRWYESFRSSLGTDVDTDIRASLDPTTLQVVEEIRARQQTGGTGTPYTATSGWGETVTVARRNAGRGAAVQLLFTTGARRLAGADFSDPRVQQQLAAEGVAAFGSEFAESAIRSRVGLTAAREGLAATAPRLMAGRLAARAMPGVADVGLEVFDMTSDQRDNSAEEVVTRVGRAAVIGTGAAYTGALVGTAIGGPVGFVVGLAAGAAVGWLANRFMPGGREYWERQHRMEQQLDHIAAQLEEIERLLEARQARQRRLDQPVTGEEASVAGVESLLGLPTENPLFLASDPTQAPPTVGEMEAEYLMTVLQATRQQSSTLALGSSP